MNRPTPKAEAHIRILGDTLIQIVWETQDIRQTMLDECGHFGVPSDYPGENLIHLIPRSIFDATEVMLYLRSLID